MKRTSLIYHDDYQLFLQTLHSYQEAGVALTVEGKAVPPEDIADLCVCREAGAYMRDYISDDRGRLVEIRFDRVENGQAE